MPITVIKKPEWGLFYYFLQGVCTSAELVEALEYGTADPIPRALAIFDFLEGDLDVETQDIAKIIKINRELHERDLITTHAGVLTLNRTLQMFINVIELLSFKEKSEIKVFTTLSESLEWMGLSEREAELQVVLNNLRGKNS